MRAVSIVIARLCVSQTHRLFNEARCNGDNRYRTRFVDSSGFPGLTQVGRHEKLRFRTIVPAEPQRRIHSRTVCTACRGRKKKVSFIVSEIQSPTNDCAHKGEEGRGEGASLPFEQGTVRRLRSGKAGISLRFRASTCAGAYTKRVYKNNARGRSPNKSHSSHHTCSVHVTLARTKISDACGLTLF